MYKLQVIYQAPIPKYKTIAVLETNCKKIACIKLKENQYKSGYIIDSLGNKTYVIQ